MKRLFQNLLLLSALASTVFMYSCNSNDTETPKPDAPTISVATKVNGTAVTAPLSVVVGDTILFDVSITAAGGFNVYRVSSSVDGGTSSQLLEASRTDLKVDAGTTSVTDSWTTAFDASFVGKTITLDFEAVDDNSQTGTATLDISVTSPAARSYSTVLLAAPIGTTTDGKTSETFFSTNTGMKYSMKTILQSSDPLSADIDFGYFYGSGTNQTGATLSDPKSYPFAYGQSAWGTLNNTTFRRTSLDASAFTEVATFADIDTAFDAADAADSDPGIESGLVAGEVLAFATDSNKDGGSKKGLILVKSITGTDGADGQIDLDIIVQETAQ